MRRSLMIAISAAALVSLALSQASQAQAPIGHRQPTAADVPANDSVRGDADLGGQTATPAPAAPDKRTKRQRAQSNLEVLTKTPNICSNCDQ
jgi:hypothetical protein